MKKSELSDFFGGNPGDKWNLNKARDCANDLSILMEYDALGGGFN